MSTLKPVRSLQRPPVSGMDFWSHEDCHPPLYPGPSFVDHSLPRRPSEVETTTTAREHPLYQVGPKEDGLYHCPFAGAEDCSHKPEKLKCNYDKHLDSHLKPYRCKLASLVAWQHFADAIIGEFSLPGTVNVDDSQAKDFQYFQGRGNEEVQIQPFDKGDDQCEYARKSTSVDAAGLASAEGGAQRSNGRSGPHGHGSLGTNQCRLRYASKNGQEYPESGARPVGALNPSLVEPDEKYCFPRTYREKSQFQSAHCGARH
ncbi:MAG: hypothetical protein Q9168_006224, partial [Polycauliona sp. 1 TL-2023]